jgi:K+ transporter
VGCLLLLLRKKWATSILIISFIGIVVQMIHAFFMANSIEVYGPGGVIMPIMVLIIGAWLIWYAKGAEKKGWIN